MKLGFLAMKWAMVEKSREYLRGHKCVVWTDSNPLSHLGSAKLGATEQRREAERSAFDYSVRHRPGRTNKNAQVREQMLPGTAVPPVVQEAAEGCARSCFRFSVSVSG